MKYLDRLVSATLGHLLLVTIVASAAQANVNYAEPVLERNVSLSLDQATLREVLLKIEEKASVKFAYSKEFVEINQTVSIKADDKKLHDVLEELLGPLDVRYEVINELIVLRKGDEEGRPFLLDAQVTIAGQVVSSEDKSPLPGVTVTAKGTDLGAMTDENGFYEIGVQGPETILVFSLLGYASAEVHVGDRRTIDVALTADVKSLEEIVVIGYGERRKGDLTGSISTVGAEDIERAPGASFELALQGKTTGVRVENNSGNPNAGPSIFVRGIGTWNGSSQPLYVLDGQVISPPESGGNQDVIGNINLWTMINPADIESISVLKDASAAAIYGSRAANGVILITTKVGKRGKPKVEFSGQYGLQNTPHFDMLNSDQLIGLWHEAYSNNTDPTQQLEERLYGRSQTGAALLNSYYPQLDPESSYYLGDRPTTYDWQKAMTNRNAVNQRYGIKVSGAGEDVDYYVSAGYTGQESVLLKNDLERFNLTTNINTDIGKHITVGFTYRISRQESFAMNPLTLEDAASRLPWQPLYDESNPTGFAYPVDSYFGGGWNQVRLFGAGTQANPLALLALNRTSFKYLRNMGQSHITLRILDGLSLRGGLSVDFNDQTRVTYEDARSELYLPDGVDPATISPTNPGTIGSKAFRNNKFLNYQADFTATYDKSFGDHSLNVLLGVQDTYYTRRTQDQQSTNPGGDQDDKETWTLGSSEPDISGFESQGRRYWYGYVARLGYNYSSRYYLDLSFRRDASNGFTAENRWGNFYAASGAWRISSEPFMEQLTMINDLKLRFGWGQAGNDEAVAGSFAYLSGITATGSYHFGSGNGDPYGTYNVGVFANGFPNRDLRWEVATTTNLGIDFLAFDYHLSGTIEVYKRVTDGILQGVSLPNSVGTANPIFNVGSLQNTGLDLLLSWSDHKNGFSYGVSGNVSFVKNKVLELYDDQPLSTAFGRVEEGRPIGHIWDYKAGGIFQTDEEIDAYFEQYQVDDGSVREFVAPGDLYFVDVYGDPTEEEPFYSTTPDGKINAFDRSVIGYTIPGYTYGLNANLGWKGLDLTLSFYGVGDVQRINSSRRRLEVLGGGGGNFWANALNRWTPSNTRTDVPRAVAGDPAGNNRGSSRWVENAGYFRLNSWQLGYTLPEQIMEWANNAFQRARLYIAGQNNIYLTRWSGIDPVNDAYPLPRTFFAGFSITF